MQHEVRSVVPGSTALVRALDNGNGTVILMAQSDAQTTTVVVNKEELLAALTANPLQHKLENAEPGTILQSRSQLTNVFVKAHSNYWYQANGAIYTTEELSSFVRSEPEDWRFIVDGAAN